MNDIRVMNTALFNASAHLLEAGKHLKGTFDEAAERMFKMADEMASIIQPEESKLSDDKMKDILSEIMKYSNNE